MNDELPTALAITAFGLWIMWFCARRMRNELGRSPADERNLGVVGFAAVVLLAGLVNTSFGGLYAYVLLFVTEL